MMGRRHKKHKKPKGKVVGFKPEWGQDLDEVYNDMINLPSIIKGKNARQDTKDNGYKGLHYGSGNTGGTTATYVTCSHPGDTVIFEHEGKQLFASNNHSLKEMSGKWDLIIDLANIISNTDNSFVKPGQLGKFDALKAYTPSNKLPSEVLRLNWPDMGAPLCTLDFWLTLWKILPAKSVIACMGGHGRTGTCLAALMIAAGVDYFQAVKDVRSIHCHKAIESMAQMKYLHTLYITLLERQLAYAIEHNTKDIADIKADIKYAEDNPPVYATKQSSGSTSPTKGQQTYMGFKV